MNESQPVFEAPICPLPLRHDDTIVIGHGSGGKMTHDLIKNVFHTHFHNNYLDQGNDFASVPMPGPNGRLSISTDGHIVSPLLFPGGDIGRLAICGTVNDMSMSGATPLYITASFIMEEGLSVQTLEKIVISMKTAAEEAGVQIIAGDTKVVEKGKGDGLFISTAGIGWIPAQIQIGGNQAQAGDAILLSGSIGDHGIAVLSARGDLGVVVQIESDVAPLNHLIQSVLKVAPHTHVLRDPTRGGLATTLNEIAQQSKFGIQVFEEQIPIRQPVQAACDLLGFDPLYIANEGKVIVIVPQTEKEAALHAMQASPYGEDAIEIGNVTTSHPGRVILKTSLGTNRILDMMAGEMLPRIC
ncbi:MAG: hydrogenase expression/formation protein HypE [Chloroflexi bacterium HGW-Chloroflexi-10]|nr:MAG: hydrogenase expression/formation protein HypE [Chloroflexi bacterium HGW-Chloroflexi-10]